MLVFDTGSSFFGVKTRPLLHKTKITHEMKASMQREAAQAALAKKVYL
jgi:hypothetical protein